MTTKEYLQEALTIIAHHGFDGTEVVAHARREALSKLTGQEIAVSAKVYVELQRHGLASVTRLNPTTFKITISPYGAQKILKQNMMHVKVTTPKTWDKKWRMICFDIPASKAKERTFFNTSLHRLGFVMLRRGIWAHPYECYSQLTVVTDYLNITRYISYITAESIDAQSERKLMRFFDQR
jgi:DNA-binding transcriptional regulator PaaX